MADGFQAVLEIIGCVSGWEFDGHDPMVDSTDNPFDILELRKLT